MAKHKLNNTPTTIPFCLFFGGCGGRVDDTTRGTDWLLWRPSQQRRRRLFLHSRLASRSIVNGIRSGKEHLYVHLVRSRMVHWLCSCLAPASLRWSLPWQRDSGRAVAHFSYKMNESVGGGGGGKMSRAAATTLSPPFFPFRAAF